MHGLRNRIEKKSGKSAKSADWLSTRATWTTWPSSTSSSRATPFTWRSTFSWPDVSKVFSYCLVIIMGSKVHYNSICIFGEISSVFKYNFTIIKLRSTTANVCSVIGPNVIKDSQLALSPNFELNHNIFKKIYLQTVF
jgi:hypothetical protein